MDVSASSRVSRWSDAPSSQATSAVTQEVANAEKRPPSVAPEPPLKKSRFESGQVQPGDSGDMPPDAGAFGSAPGIHGYGASSENQSFTYGNSSGDHSYGSFPFGSAKGSGTASLFYKTKLCTKFKLGSCTFNERCHFAHGMEDLRKPMPGWEEAVKQGAPFNMGSMGRSAEPARKSSKPCRYYVDGNCPYGERCTFSHGNEDVQRGAAPSMDSLSGSGIGNAPGRSNYKTRLCTRWEKGEPCMYGDKCHFAHGQAELQAYSGGTNYNSTPLTAPTMYADPNQPAMAAPYGVPENYAGAGGPPPICTSLNPYPVAGGNLTTYGSEQDVTNGYSTNYSYWNPENKWDGSNPSVVPRTSTLPSQGYSQANQNAPWMANYSVDGGYSKNEAPAASYYSQEQSQHQPAAPYYGNAPTYQGPSQSIASAYRGPIENVTPSYQGPNQGAAPTYGVPSESVPHAYPGPNQGVNPSYVQDGPRNGDGGAYYGASYPIQPAGYIGSYNGV